MKRVKLDRIDMKILQYLQEDGRMTNVDLAQKVGISAPPCLRRVKALEDSGFIKSYHANLSAEKLGYGVIIFTQVSLSSHNTADWAQFQKLLNTWPMVREAYMVTGDCDAILKVVAESWESYQLFLTTQVMAAPNVTQVKSTMVLQSTKFVPGIPVTDASLRNVKN